MARFSSEVSLPKVIIKTKADQRTVQFGPPDVVIKKIQIMIMYVPFNFWECSLFMCYLVVMVSAWQEALQFEQEVGKGNLGS